MAKEGEEGKSKALNSKDTITEAQANYKGSSMHETVLVKIEKANKYYKVGDLDNVHPATAEIFKELGLISEYPHVPVEEKK